MTRKFTFSIGEYYHLFDRGVDKRLIFQDIQDYERFMKLLYLCNDTKPVHTSSFQGSTLKEVFSRDRTPLVALAVDTLMPNHLHLLAKEITDNGISQFMQKLITAYTMYFNIKNKRTGALFSGRFKAEHITNDNHLKYLYSYIHLNPLSLIQPDWKEIGINNTEEAKLFLNNFRYSSYIDYINPEFNRQYKNILNKEVFPEYFRDPIDFNSFIDFWIDFKQG